MMRTNGIMSSNLFKRCPAGIPDENQHDSNIAVYMSSATKLPAGSDTMQIIIRKQVITLRRASHECIGLARSLYLSMKE